MTCADFLAPTAGKASLRCRVLGGENEVASFSRSSSSTRRTIRPRPQLVEGPRDEVRRAYRPSPP